MTVKGVTMLELGSAAPEVTVQNEKGENVRLSDFAGRYVVLYAYPKDNTSGCTTEACSFRDNLPAIESRDAVLLGLSPDSPGSHQKFIAKYELNFTLLSDPEHELLEALGAWGEKKMYGKTYMGVIRSTFVFDPEGKLIQVWPKVQVKTHGEEVSEFLASL